MKETLEERVPTYHILRVPEFKPGESASREKRAGSTGSTVLKRSQSPEVAVRDVLLRDKWQLRKRESVAIHPTKYQEPVIIGEFTDMDPRVMKYPST